ncbi:hypothetical protein Acr_05g0010500 [Actinidia rufa]|uniref:Uncharacterized protein n=1 Tax=Actinidia rufa TaxID=165716 RepID=A0A7J0ELR5_9ERIC|nr:hypothetical protein Acr_05g0010500 [Actinidia rufa]
MLGSFSACSNVTGTYTDTGALGSSPSSSPGWVPSHALTSQQAEISSNLDEKELRGLYLCGETGNKRDKPLHGPFLAKILNDLFGIQARGGCACAGPYGHSLLNVDEPLSLSFKSAIQMGMNFEECACLPTPTMKMQTINLNCHELKDNQHDVDDNNSGMINNYATYLEAAKHIAGLLPKVPSQLKVPEDLPFRV